MNQVQRLFLLIAVGAVFAFLYGFVHLLKNKRGCFYSFAVLGLFGFATGRIFLFFLSVISGESIEVFSIGSLGTVSGFLCMTFACSTIEKVDSNEIKNGKKYKLIPLVMPALYAVFMAFMLAGSLGFEAMILPCIYSFSVVPCAYYCLRNIITPYPKNSFMKGMRPFFTTMLLLCVNALLAELMWLMDEAYTQTASVVLTVCGTLCYAASAVFLERGNQKWMKM